MKATNSLTQMLQPCGDGGRCLGMAEFREHGLRNHDFAKKLMQNLCLSDENQVVQRRGVCHDDA